MNEPVLHRLSIFISTVLSIGFFLVSGYSYYKYSEALDNEEYYRERVLDVVGECTVEKKQYSCEQYVRRSAMRDENTQQMFAYQANWKMFLFMGIAAPLLSLLLFRGLRWVLAGRIPK